MKKRKLFDDLLEGMEALARERGGKVTLRTTTLELKSAPRVSARELLKLRRGLKTSRGLFAGYLRSNVRTLED